MRRPILGFAIAALLPAAAVSALEPPASLRETGLYSDWAAKTVDLGNLRYTPQYPLWSDGAVKPRSIQIPAGQFVDASDPDSWEFPVGTKLWKEFRIGGRRVETRYVERSHDRRRPEGDLRVPAHDLADREQGPRSAPARGSAGEVGGRRPTPLEFAASGDGPFR